MGVSYNAGPSPFPAAPFSTEFIRLDTTVSGRFNRFEITNNDMFIASMPAYYNVYVTTDDWTTYQEVLVVNTYPTITGTRSHQLDSPVEARNIAVVFIRIGNGVNPTDEYVRVDELSFTLV